MARLLFISSLCILALAAQASELTPVPQGFPARWDGDRFFKSQCEVVQKPPSWVDGYFFCQLCGSYGDAASEEGQHVDHMFDSIGGLAVFDMAPEKTTFTGAYYPSRAYKIWNFYDRDFAKSSIAWRPAYAEVNLTQWHLWEKIMPEWGKENHAPSIRRTSANPHLFTIPDLPAPNVDFWKIKNDIVGGTEYYPVGLTFDIDTVDHFRSYPFKEAAPTMLGQPLFPIHMPIHERMDPDTGLLWATVSALDVTKRPPSLHQVIFSVDEDGVRRVEGIHDYTAWDPSKCQQDGFYAYDPQRDFFPRNMHSITSTQHYVILPLTSVVFNPCSLLKGPKSPETKFGSFYKWNQETKVTFLVFDKRSKKFLDTPIIYKGLPQFISHQFNAYEISETKLVADMIGYSEDAYDSLSRKKMTQAAGLPFAHVYRYTLDLEKKTVEAKSIVPDDPTNLEFPQFNHNFEGKQYKYGYAITDAYYAGNQIVKIDITDPSGKNNKVFQPRGGPVSLLEPYFAQRPGSTEEDDGVVVSRGYDISVNKTRVYVLDAKTLEQVGEMLAPVDTPFGFHERFYLKDAFEPKKGSKKAKQEL